MPTSINAGMYKTNWRGDRTRMRRRTNDGDYAFERIAMRFQAWAYAAARGWAVFYSKPNPKSVSMPAGRTYVDTVLGRITVEPDSNLELRQATE